jgi:ABC-type antimicrobial peptide transport system permease subunit
LIARVIACLGVVGLVSYSVSQRTKEIGSRMALGARPAHVLSVVMSQLTRPIFVGLLLGVALTVAVAALLPARRALRVDPLRCLRYE